MEKAEAHKVGIAKVIPPPEWNKPHYDFDRIGEIVILEPLIQEIKARMEHFNLLVP
jgi:hypothetical protein